MTARCPSVLTIFIPGQGFIKQGKFCYLNDKPFFIANMTKAKEWRNFSGYSIALRVLEALPRGTRIVYKRPDLNQYYETTKTTFTKKGILVKYGNHRQLVLPIKNWQATAGKFEEPHQLPVMSLDRWLKRSPEQKSGLSTAESPSGDILSQRFKMAELFRSATA